MRVAIVEDEPYFIGHITKLLREWSEKERLENLQIAPYKTGESIIEEYEQRNTDYDIIFMDIGLGQIDGIETSRWLRQSGYGGAIVFITNHQEYKYVQQGYDVDALNYLAKPVQLEDVASCMERLKQNTLFRYTYNGVHWSLPHKEILFFESMQHYMKTHTLHSDIETSLFKSTVQDLLQQLPKFYIRTHRSYITNTMQIIKIQNNMLYLRNNIILPIGNHYLDNVLSTFQSL